MKRRILLTTITLSALISACIIAGSGCKRETGGGLPAGSQNASAEKNSFKEVTSRLDSGGNFYLYLGTEQWLEGLSGKVSNWRQFVASLPDNEADRDKVGKAFDIVTRLIKESGVEDVSGFGMSSIVVEPGLYHTKNFLHHYPGRGDGFLWKLGGQKPHSLEGLNMLPANTAFAAFSDLDVPLAWSVIKDQVGKAGIPEADKFLSMLPAQFEKTTGLKWEQALNSLGGEFGIVVTLDEANKIKLPGPGGQQLEIPTPGIMIVAKVKDETFFNRVDELLSKNAPQAERTDKAGLKMRVVPLPVPFIPIPLRPTIATSDGYLFIATGDAVVQDALAVKSGKAGLKSTDEFKQISKDIPDTGNSFAFVSQRLGKCILDIQQNAFRMGGGARASQIQTLQSLLTSQKAGMAYSVSANTDEGWFTVGNGNQDPVKTLVASTIVAPVAIGAAMALPALAKAKQRAQEISCVNNMKQMCIAAKIWAGDHNDAYPPDFTSMSKELSSPRILVCPQDTAHHPATDWSSFNASANCSYEYLAPSLKDQAGEQNRVVFRCPVHGTVGLADGSVQAGVGKTHPDWLVNRNGKLYLQLPNNR